MRTVHQIIDNYIYLRKCITCTALKLQQWHKVNHVHQRKDQNDDYW